MRKSIIAALMAATIATVAAPAHAQDGERRGGWSRNGGSEGHGRPGGGNWQRGGGDRQPGMDGGAAWRGRSGDGFRQAPQAQAAPQAAPSPAPAPAPAPQARTWESRRGGDGERGVQSRRPYQYQVPADLRARLQQQRGDTGNWRQRDGQRQDGVVGNRPGEDRNWADRNRPDRNAADRGPDRNWADRNRDGRDWNRGNDNRWDNRGWESRSRESRNADGRNWNGRDWNRNGNRYGYDQRLNDRARWADQRRWSRDWRSDRRYDWQRYRAYNRGYYRLPAYYAPYGWNYGYRRFSIGIFLNSMLFANDYWIDDPAYYRLPPAYGSLRWVRYYDDALLVDMRDGYVVDVVYDFFW